MKARAVLRAKLPVKLRDADAGDTPLRKPETKHATREQIRQQERDKTDQLTARLAEQQQMLFATRKGRVLLVLQGMDTSGKDGVLRAMFSRINPMGLRGVQFKAPSLDELAHDFLWRVHRQVPAAGEIVIFNRSHYEDVLVPRVHDVIDAAECERRYAHIRDFERMLSETGTVIVKIFLHISCEEQRERLQARLDDPDKQWKFDANDLVQRERWDQYQAAYAAAINATDTDYAPWYVIPADSKVHRNLLVADLLLEIMEKLKLSFPLPDPALSKLKVK